MEYISNNIKVSESNSETILLIDKKEINNHMENNYKTFMMEYYNHQSTFLNIWIGTFAILLAILGIIIPFIFHKSEERRNKGFRIAIENFKHERNLIFSDIDDAKKELDSIGNIVKETMKKEQLKSKLYNQASSLLVKNDYKEAIEKSKQILKIDKGYMDAVYLQAISLSALAKEETYKKGKEYTYNSRKLLQKIINTSINYDDVTFSKTKVILSLSNIELQLENFKEAYEYIEMAKEEDPSSITVYHVELIYFSTIDDLDNAEKVLDEMERLEGQDSTWKYNKAEVLFRKKQYKASLALYQEATKHNDISMSTWEDDYKKIIDPIRKTSKSRFVKDINILFKNRINN